MTAIRFSINRTCAPQMSLAQFLALAENAGVAAVEVRNDVSGREIADGTAVADLRSVLAGAGLSVASINALQRFNDLTEERAHEALRLIRYAAQLGAPGVVMCPVVEANHGWSGADLEAKLRQSLRVLRPMFADHGVTGYVEPLGMTDSTMKRQETAVAAVTDIDGWDAFRICHDTFQFYRCGDERMFPEHIGLVHISGIARTDLPAGELAEPDRGLVFAGDRVGNIAQLERLIGAGYAGYVSFEPFDPAVQQDPAIAARLMASIDYVSGALGSAGRASIVAETNGEKPV